MQVQISLSTDSAKISYLKKVLRRLHDDDSAALVQAHIREIEKYHGSVDKMSLEQFKKAVDDVTDEG